MDCRRDLHAAAGAPPDRARGAAAGKHVLLEKPPAATLSETRRSGEPRKQAGKASSRRGTRNTMPAVDEARKRLAGQKLRRRHQVTWKEDVRRWHPGQAWIWQAGGSGVFDPGINALSIVTRIVPEPVFVRAATLERRERRSPHRGDPGIGGGQRGRAVARGVRLGARPAAQTWDIDIETAAGTVLALRHGGSRLEVDGALVLEEKPKEYEGSIDASRSYCAPIVRRSMRRRSDWLRTPSWSVSA